MTDSNASLWPGRLGLAILLTACGASGSGSTGTTSESSGTVTVSPPTSGGPASTDGADGTDDSGPAGTSEGSATQGESSSSTGIELEFPWDWAGVIGTGQSLSVGALGNPVATTEQPYGNLQLSLGGATGWPLDPLDPTWSMVPLVEPIGQIAPGYPSAYPQNIYGETPHTSMANQVTALVQTVSRFDYVGVHTAVGESGQAMSRLRKGAEPNGTVTGRAYAATLFAVEATAHQAAMAGLAYGVGAIIITHGESDAGNPNYGDELVQLWSDYNDDLPVLTAQETAIPMLVSQQNSVPGGPGTRSASTLAQWQVGRDHPGEIVCVGPTYQYPYDPDQVHLMALGYQLLGEKYGAVYFEKVVLGHDWQPLQATGVSRSGNVITVEFHVPVPPLAWDEKMPLPHDNAMAEWAQGRGFEVRSGEGRVVIESVEIVDDTVQITCADLPDAGVTVGYAMTTGGLARPGGTVRWGLLRDSDPFVGSTTGQSQQNYAVAFEWPVP
ncbi:MAG: dockerin [Myxococcota bacterium]